MIKTTIMVINTNIMFLQSCFLCPRTRNLFYTRLLSTEPVTHLRISIFKCATAVCWTSQSSIKLLYDAIQRLDLHRFLLFYALGERGKNFYGGFEQNTQSFFFQSTNVQYHYLNQFFIIIPYVLPSPPVHGLRSSFSACMPSNLLLVLILSVQLGRFPDATCQLACKCLHACKK